jgi:hypothetical protein
MQMNKRYQHIVNGWVIPGIPDLIGAQTTPTTAPRDLSADAAFSADFNLPILPQDSPGGLAAVTASDRSLVADAEDIEDARAALRDSNECMDYEDFRRELGVD